MPKVSIREGLRNLTDVQAFAFPERKATSHDQIAVDVHPQLFSQNLGSTGSGPYQL